ncbi:hypothetical protein [Desulfotruncus alcoholivorax]|uniref:hypothetical protein n=1 Tax=Desulfotruncus alcoholivorax TaxID=265477 RepID=UPI000485083A|nr:hypothetical protein [Desulfotruncus alcoholivorax]
MESMELALITASIGLVCILSFLLYSMSEKQKKKTLMVGMISKSLLELNQNKEILKIILQALKPRELTISLESIKENQEEKKLGKKPLPIVLEPPIFKYEEIELLKTNNEFLIYSDISISVELNNVILRIKYLNQLFPELMNVSALSTDDYKTAYHTYEMIEKLVKEFEVMLTKLKN